MRVLIRQQESDDRHFQSLGLAEWSAEQRVKMQLDSCEALCMECTSSSAAIIDRTAGTTSILATTTTSVLLRT